MEKREIYLEQETPVKISYMCFTMSHNVELAVKKFRDKYGVEPKRVFTQARLLHVGPVPEINQESFIE